MKELKEKPTLKLGEPVIIDGKKYLVAYIDKSHIAFFGDDIPMLKIRCDNGILLDHEIIEYPPQPTAPKLCVGCYVTCPKCSSELEICEAHHQLTKKCNPLKEEIRICEKCKQNPSMKERGSRHICAKCAVSMYLKSCDAYIAEHIKDTDPACKCTLPKISTLSGRCWECGKRMENKKPRGIDKFKVGMRVKVYSAGGNFKSVIKKIKGNMLNFSHELGLIFFHYKQCRILKEK